MKVALAGHALLGLTLLAGCGRIGYQAQAAPDAHRDDADAVSRDAAADLGDARGDRIPTGDAPNDADGNAGDTGPPTMDAPATDTMSDATSPDGRFGFRFGRRSRHGRVRGSHVVHHRRTL